MSTHFLETILPGFYRCAEQPENWQPVLDRLRDELQVSSVVIQLLDLDQGRFRNRWEVRDSLSCERAELHDRLVNNDQNPRFDTDALSLTDEQNVIRDEDRFAPDCPRFAAFRERLRQAGLGRSITLDVYYAESIHLSMTLHRAYDDSRDFSRRQEQLLCQLAPHLRQTVSLSEKMGQVRERAETMSQAVNHINAGLLTVDGDGQVRWLNDCARRIVDRSRHLKLVGTRLRCGNSEDQRVLAELIWQAASADGVAAHHPIAILGQSWDNPLQVLAVPVRQCDMGLSRHAGMSVFVALYLTETGARVELPVGDIAHLFGLTPAEARLAVAMAQGVALDDYAQQQGIAVGTARVQLKSIFSKVGVSRQPELVRLLCTSIAARMLTPVSAT